MTPATHTDPFGLVGRTLAGKFVVESVVAAGGFGTLYRATHVSLQRPVAIKVLRAPEGQTEQILTAMRAAFEQEARMIASLSHPAIVHAIEFDVEATPSGPLMWMALEWLEGRPFHHVLRDRNGAPYSRAEVFALMHPVLEALAYAHEHGVAHRDLKPANIMALEGRRGMFLKLIDFGIAKTMEQGESAGSGETVTGSVLSAYSPRYAAPEQIGRGRTGPWTDVHASALILTEMLVGHPAYDASDPTALVAAALNPMRPTPAAFGVDLGAWEPVLRKALAIRAADRYPHSGAFLDALEHATSSTLTGAPVAPIAKGPSRRWLVPTLGVAVVVAAAVVGIGMRRQRMRPVQLQSRVEPAAPIAMPAVPAPRVVAPSAPAVPEPRAVVPAPAGEPSHASSRDAPHGVRPLNRPAHTPSNSHTPFLD